MLLAHTAEEPEAKKEFIQDLTKAIGMPGVDQLVPGVDQLVEPSFSLLGMQIVYYFLIAILRNWASE